RAKDLSGLPPTYILVGAIDPFLDEDLRYARRLAHCSVPVDVRVYAGAPHGFVHLAPRSAPARRATEEMTKWLRTVNTRTSAPGNPGTPQPPSADTCPGPSLVFDNPLGFWRFGTREVRTGSL